VGDYAYLLACKLRFAYDIHTRFLVGDPSEERATQLNGFGVDCITVQQSTDLDRQLGASRMPSIVLLHYVGYGYQQRGCPTWLVKGLESWKKRDGNRRLVVMFHELYALGPPWRSSFWTSWIQRRLVTSLARIGDHCITNRNESMRELIRLAGCAKQKLSVLPVFSNVGEPKFLPGLAARKPRMVVFGSAAWRRQAYYEHRRNLEAACQKLGIEEIVDIGVPVDHIPELTVPCVSKGILPAHALSYELLNASAGFFTYPAAYLGKSTIFAAYAAHGLAPVTYADNLSLNQDGLVPDEHFISVALSKGNESKNVERVARAANRWYAEHTVSEHALRYSNFVRETLEAT
jgi:hypothetical protein